MAGPYVQIPFNEVGPITLVDLGGTGDWDFELVGNEPWCLDEHYFFNTDPHLHMTGGPGDNVNQMFSWPIQNPVPNGWRLAEVNFTLGYIASKKVLAKFWIGSESHNHFEFEFFTVAHPDWGDPSITDYLIHCSVDDFDDDPDDVVIDMEGVYWTMDDPLYADAHEEDFRAVLVPGSSVNDPTSLGMFPPPFIPGNFPYSTAEVLFTSMDLGMLFVSTTTGTRMLRQNRVKF
jgi:hypothetical protein